MPRNSLFVESFENGAAKRGRSFVSKRTKSRMRRRNSREGKSSPVSWMMAFVTGGLRKLPRHAYALASLLDAWPSPSCRRKRERLRMKPASSLAFDQDHRCCRAPRRALAVLMIEVLATVRNLEVLGIAPALPSRTSRSRTPCFFGEGICKRESPRLCFLSCVASASKPEQRRKARSNNFGSLSSFL